MSTSFAIILAAYLVGYFISFGIVFGISEEADLTTFGTAVVLSLLSWISVGVFLADLLPSNTKSKP